MNNSYRHWFTGLLACILLFSNVLQPELTQGATTEQVIPISGDVQIITNGIYELTGEDSTPREIRIADGVTDVVLRQQFSDTTLMASILTYNTGMMNLTIDGLQLQSLWSGAIDLRGSGEVHLILKGKNSLDTSISTSQFSSPPAIGVEGSAKLTISGDGSLSATSGGGAAGIGSGAYNPTGTIVINSGTIVANDRSMPGVTNGGAGIGGGYGSLPGKITINGGTIQATGSYGGAGIGGGSFGNSGPITINDGMIYATGSNGSAGIGGGGGGNSSEIDINGGQIKAIGGYLNYNGHLSGAGIGGGYNDTGGKITITDGLIVASGGAGYSAGVGGGSIFSNGGYVTNSATINLLGGMVFSAPGYDGNMLSGDVNPNAKAPLLLTLTFMEPDGTSQIPVKNAEIFVKNISVQTDQNGTIGFHVVAGEYTLADFKLSGANGYRAISLTPSTILGDEQQANTGTVLWSNRYALNWQLEGGTLKQSPVTEAVYGTAIVAPSPAPQRSGFTFGGWYTDTSHAQEILFPFSLQEDIELFARWTANPLNLPSALLKNGTYGESYSALIPDATGGTGDYTFVVSDGDLPDGLILNGRVIEGVTEKVGQYVFEVTATDTTTASTAKQSYTINIEAAIPVLQASVQAGTIYQGQSLLHASLSGEFQHPTTGEVVPGNLSWVEPALVPLQDGTIQEWVFIPTDAYNYTDVRGTVQVSWVPILVPGNNPNPNPNSNSVLSANADLAELLVRAGDNELVLSPSFAPETTAYMTRTNEAQIKIAWKTVHPAAKVRLSDKLLTHNTEIELAVGENLVVLTAQAENGTSKTYRLTIQRDNGNPDIPTEPSRGFYDIYEDWAEPAIERAARQGLVSGYPDGTFKPDKPITRAEFTVLLARALQWNHVGAELAFIDREQIGAWATEAVVQAVQLGVLNGYADGSFRPNAVITRAEMATMIARSLGLQTTAATTAFTDDDAIPAWAKGAVEASRLQGIVIGRADNRFEPNAFAHRAEATVMILRMLD